MKNGICSSSPVGGLDAGVHDGTPRHRAAADVLNGVVVDTAEVEAPFWSAKS
jgi:hypothetical protein